MELLLTRRLPRTIASNFYAGVKAIVTMNLSSTQREEQESHLTRDNEREIWKRLVATVTKSCVCTKHQRMAVGRTSDTEESSEL